MERRPILWEPFKVFERILVFQLPIRQPIRCRQWKFIANLDEIFFSFHNLQSQMGLSKLWRLNPSAIDKCAMVFVPPLAIEKWRNGGVNTIAQFTNAQSIHPGFTKWKTLDEDKKKFIPQLAIDTEFFHRAFANPWTM